jgi:hypothetical protein
MSIESHPVSLSTPAGDHAVAELAGDGLDMTPPPDHEGWVEACANGLRAIRERREKRRRAK